MSWAVVQAACHAVPSGRGRLRGGVPAETRNPAASQAEPEVQSSLVPAVANGRHPELDCVATDKNVDR